MRISIGMNKKIFIISLCGISYERIGNVSYFAIGGLVVFQKLGTSISWFLREHKR